METSPEEGTALDSSSSDSNNTSDTGQQHESQANTSLLPSQHRCNGCGRFLKSSGGLKNHQRSCKSSENTELQIETTTIVNAEILLIEQEDDINIITPYLPKVEICQSVDDNIEDQLWGNMPYASLVNNVNEIYEVIVTFR